MTLLQLQKRRDDALKAVANAKNDTARTKAVSDLDAASLALAAFQANLSAKTVKTVKKEERYEEEDESEDEEESDEDADDEPKKPASDDDGDDDAGDDDDDDDDDGDSDDSEEEEDEDEDEDEEEDEDEKAAAAALDSARSVLKSAKKGGDAKAIAASRATLKAVKRAVKPKAIAKYRSLKATCQRVTGKKGMRAILGALEGMSESLKIAEKNSAAIERLKADSRREKVNALVRAARIDGRVSKDEVDALRADGMRMGTKWLKSRLSVRPKLVRSQSDGPLDGRTLGGSKDGDPDASGARAAAFDAQHMSAEQRKAVETLALDAGKSFDEFVAEMNATANKRTNGAAGRAQ